MRFGRYAAYISGIDAILLAPLINLLFLLAVFSFLFLGYMPFGAGIKVDLPRSLTSRPLKYPLAEITIKDDGSLLLNGSEASQADLAVFLKHLAGKKTGVLVNADKRAPLQSVIAVWDAVRESGVADCLTAAYPG